jgi:hypothetical protein
MKRIVSVACVALLVLTNAQRAMAVSAADAAVADALFRAARELMNQGDFGAACPKFEESLRLDPAVGTVLNLALCHEKAGRLASAWATYQEAQAMAERQNLADRAKIASQHRAEIESRLPYLTLALAPDADVSGLEITLDGKVVQKPSLGVRLPVDPGPHSIEITAPNFAQRSERIDLSERQERTLTIEKLAQLPNASASDVPKGPAGLATAPVTRVPAAPGADSGKDSKSASQGHDLVLPIALAGVGAVLLGVGTYAGIHAMHRMSDSDAACPNNACTEAGAKASRDANVYANVSNITIPLGLAAGGFSAWLFYQRAGKARGAPGQTSFDFNASPNVVTVTWQRQF